MQLKKDISILNLLFIGIGSIVGSGWLFASFYAAQIAGPAAIFSWILGGLCIAIIALVYAELTTMLPLSGGSIAFPLLGFGKMSSAVFGWVTWLGMVVIAPIEVQAVIQYASNYIPSIVQKVGSAEVLTEKGFFLAAVLMLTLNIINMVGVKIMAETNKFIVIWKLIIPVAAAIILLTFKTHPANLTAAEGFAPFGFNGILTAIAVGGISFSYMGFQNVIFLAGETKNPQRAIPIALFGSIIICMFLYLMLQIGFILSVNPSALLNGGWSKISFAGDAGPFAGIFLTLGLVFMAKVLYFDAVLSPMGTGVSYVASSSRILYYLSLHKDVPKVLSQVNRFSVPWVAIIVNFIAGMCIFLPFSGWQSMVAFLVAAQVIALACGPVCLPLFRKRFADFKRPFLLPYSTLISFAAFYVCNLMLQWTGWSTIWKLEIAVGIGIALFLFSYLVNGKFKSEKIHFKSFIWLALYLIFSGVISYFGTFGGGTGVISMKMSFLVVAISSFIVFVIAQKSAIEPTETKEIYEKFVRNKSISLVETNVNLAEENSPSANPVI